MNLAPQDRTALCAAGPPAVFLIAPLAPLFLRHGQRLRKLLARGVQGVCAGLATGFFHEGRMPC